MMMLSPSTSRTKNWPGSLDLLGPPGADPHPAEQPSISRLKYVPVDVVARRQRARPRRHHVARLDSDPCVLHGDDP